MFKLPPFPPRLPFPGEPPFIGGKDDEEEIEDSSLSELDGKFMGLPNGAKEQAMNYIGNWRKQDVKEAVEKWKEGLSTFGVTPGPETTRAYEEETRRKIKR